MYINSIRTAAMYLQAYFSIFLIIVGTVLNGLSFKVLGRKVFQNSTTAKYLRFLAVVDTISLYVCLSREICLGMTQMFDSKTYDFRWANETVCKAHAWASAFMPDVCAWTLVAMTTERMLAVVLPHKVKVICSKRRVCVTLWLVVVLNMVGSAPKVIFLHSGISDYDPENNMTYILDCGIKKKTSDKKVYNTSRPCISGFFTLANFKSKSSKNKL